MIWFTADEHYGHENARTGWPDRVTGTPSATPRPFGSQKDMIDGLIAAHNAVVKDGDDVWHIGDMFWRTLTTRQCIDIVKRLNGRHWYVRGNHEEAMEPEYGVRQLFGAVYERKELRFASSELMAWKAGEPRPKKAEQLVVLDHYAGRVWNGCHRGSWQLFGHSHGVLSNVGLRQMDVGVDANGFAPVSLEKVAEFMRVRPATPGYAVWGRPFRANNPDGAL